MQRKNVTIIERLDTDDTSIHTVLVDGLNYVAVATANGGDYIIMPSGHVNEWILDADPGTLHRDIADAIAEVL